MSAVFVPADEDALRGCVRGYYVSVVDKTASTNSDLLRYIKNGGNGEQLLVSRVQTGGKGRLGRSFVSDYGGIYFSFTATVPREFVNRLTPLAGVAAARALRTLYGLDVMLKWVNDVWLGGKKLGGILAETVTDNACTGSTVRAVVGIGINGNNAGFPDTATSLEAVGVPVVDANDIIAHTLDGFTSRLCRIGDVSVMDEYRALSAVVGHHVRVHTFDISADYDAFAVGITDDGGLDVKTEHGEKVLSSGEVSVRL